MDHLIVKFHLASCSIVLPPWWIPTYKNTMYLVFLCYHLGIEVSCFNYFVDGIAYHPLLCLWRSYSNFFQDYPQGWQIYSRKWNATRHFGYVNWLGHLINSLPKRFSLHAFLYTAMSYMELKFSDDLYT